MNHIEKRARVGGIINKLDDDLSKNTLSDPIRRSSLEQLKVYGRDPNGADAIYCKTGIETLSKYAFGSYSSSVVHEALRVIANALLLQPPLQVAFIELDGVTAVAKLYQNQDDDFEFLGARVLFLCTYTAKSDFTGAFSAELFQSIERHLTRHADGHKDGQSITQPLEIMAINETAKLIFNIDHRYPDDSKALNPAVPSLCTILQATKDTTPALDPPIGTLLNALACLDFGAVPAGSATQADGGGRQQLHLKIIDILGRSIKQYKPTEMDTIGLSLITVLRMLYDTSSAQVQASMRKELFPADSERDLPLGQSSSLASQILRLATSPGLNNLPAAIGGLLYEMSDKNSTTFIKNIGFGYASGYLMTHNIPFPDSLKNPSHDPATIDTPSGTIPVNPVTGQRLDRESDPDVPEMTEEEKEREAERLFVLFERLRATGVVNVENPVTQAVREGRLRELPDDDVD